MKKKSTSGPQVGFPRLGKIHFADNKVDADTGTWQLRGIFANHDFSLTPGLFVRIRLPMGSAYKATLVSEQALGTDQGQKYVYVVDKDNKVNYRRIQVGRLHHGLRAISDGLAVGEHVIVSGLQRARPNGEVTPSLVPMPRCRRNEALISRFFIDRPIFAAVLSILITLAGGIALFTLPLAQFPSITPPTVQVTCNYPGANASEVANAVAAPIEQQVNGVESMMYMASQCANDGSYNLTVTFHHGIDINLAQVLVQNRVNLAVPLLPEVIRQTGVTTRKRSPDILCGLALNSPDGRYDQLYLSNFALMQIKDELARVPGVGDVFLFGQQDYSMRLWLDPNKLAARRLSASDVVAAIQEQNAQVASGSIGQEPMAGKQEYQLPLSTLGRLATVEQFENIVVKTGAEGRLTRLKDVGRVELGAKNLDIGVPHGRPRHRLLGDLSNARRQRPGCLRSGLGEDGRSQENVSRGRHLRHGLRHDALHARVDSRSRQDARRRHYSSRDRRAAVFAELPLSHHSTGGGAGRHHRHLRRDGPLGFQPQQLDLVRADPGDRHRGG